MPRECLLQQTTSLELGWEAAVLWRQRSGWETGFNEHCSSVNLSQCLKALWLQGSPLRWIILCSSALSRAWKSHVREMPCTRELLRIHQPFPSPLEFFRVIYKSRTVMSFIKQKDGNLVGGVSFMRGEAPVTWRKDAVDQGRVKNASLFRQTGLRSVGGGLSWNSVLLGQKSLP